VRLRGGTRILQAYFTLRGATGRVRMAGQRAYLTVKGPPRGIVRQEFEHRIPTELARLLMRHLCLPGRIVKTRHRIRYAGWWWEVDVFGAANRGLILAEVELDHPRAVVSLPPWAAMEVSLDRRFTNSFLARHPFGAWSEERRKRVRTAMVRNRPASGGHA
jgi:CYTH domain-containing protein